MKRTTFLSAVAVLAAAALVLPYTASARGVDVSKRSGIHEITHTWDSAPHDFNGDGRADLLVGTHYEGPARLYRNRGGGRFTRVSNSKFPSEKRDRHNCDWGDVNRDGLDDLYCSVGGGRGYKRNPNELWIQRRNGSFIDRAGIFRVRNLDGRGRDVAFLDVNKDGFVDLFVGNDFPRHDGHISRNKLFLNAGGRRFREAPGYGVDKRRVGGQTVEAVDYDHDGWTDLMVCGDRRLYLYRNIRGQRFRNVSSRTNTNMPCETVEVRDMNGDGQHDLLVLKERRLIIKPQRNGVFGAPLYRRGVRRAGDLATGLVDGDQRPDVYVLQMGSIGRDRPDLMLLNRRGASRFKQVGIPQTRRGKGDTVQAIDHDRNGRTDFVVLNGDHKARGPVRLVAFGR